MPLRNVFHHMRSQIITIWAMILMIFIGLVPGNILADQNTSSNDKALKNIQNKISDAHERARVNDEKSSSLDQQISVLREDLVSAARKIHDAEDTVFTREDRLEVLNINEQKLKLALKSKYAHMAKTLAAMQRLSQQPAELIAFRPDKAINSLRSASLLKVLQPELSKRATVIRRDMSELSVVRKKMLKEREQLKDILSALTSKQIEINRLLTDRRLRQKELSQETKAERRKLEQFAAQAKNLKDLIAKIKQENKAREKAALAAAKRLTDKPGLNKQPNIKKSARLNYDSIPGGVISFKNAKGSIPLPARGAIRRTFGKKTQKGLSSKGIIIHTRPLATVVSPHEGRIVFAGKFRSYGLLLIISHGPEYHTLLAGMNRLDAEVGQWVLKGEPIGQMAEKTKPAKLANTVAGQNLYVELRRMGKPINLLPWIVARDRKVL